MKTIKRFALILLVARGTMGARLVLTLCRIAARRWAPNQAVLCFVFLCPYFSTSTAMNELFRSNILHFIGYLSSLLTVATDNRLKCIGDLLAEVAFQRYWCINLRQSQEPTASTTPYDVTSIEERP